MSKIDVLDILRTRQLSPIEFDFDNLMIPSIDNYLTPQDVNALRLIATSLRLAAKIDRKYKMIDDIMKPRGFKRFSAGTNRVIYSYLEDPTFVVKIAVDKVGMQDNPMEYMNQQYLRPYCAKTFYVTPCGTVAFSERVVPVKSVEEFRSIAPDVFEIIVYRILGDYVIEDIGTKFFMNWGVRRGVGPVLLDYPYLYKLDGGKLVCNNTDEFGNVCGGEIDYDYGFNFLYCHKCGKRYLASDLRDDSPCNRIVIKGGNRMRIQILKNDKVVLDTIPQKETIDKKDFKKNAPSNTFKVALIEGEKETVYNVADGKIKPEKTSNIIDEEVKDNEAFESLVVDKADGKKEEEMKKTPKPIDLKLTVDDEKSEAVKEIESIVKDAINDSSDDKQPELPPSTYVKVDDDGQVQLAMTSDNEDVSNRFNKETKKDEEKKEEVKPENKPTSGLKKTSSTSNRDAKGRFTSSRKAISPSDTDNFVIRSKFIPSEE